MDDTTGGSQFVPITQGSNMHLGANPALNDTRNADENEILTMLVHTTSRLVDEKGENNELQAANNELKAANNALAAEVVALKAQVAELQAQIDRRRPTPHVIACGECGGEVSKGTKTRLSRFRKYLAKPEAVCPACLFGPHRLKYCGMCKAPHRNGAVGADTRHTEKLLAIRPRLLSCTAPGGHKRGRGAAQSAQKRPCRRSRS